ncbi:MAG: FAD-dependent oxidoreductase, partial [Candidatus Rokuibacteriota bacterium]
MSRLVGLEGASVDAVVIGGGMAGAGVARDLALRGASVALFEKGDFASGTSSKSSKLIHGGLRYLELMDFGLVRESLREKKTLERLAPHLVRPLPFLVPVYRGGTRGLVMVRIGLTLYNLLTPGKTTDRYRLMRPVEARALEPGIEPEDLRGVGYYFDDLLLSPERLCLENLLSAVRHGARAYNYCAVEEVARGEAGAQGVRVRDLLTGRVHAVGARVIVNCAGPWVDRLREMAGLADERPRILRTTKGIHCLLPRMTERAVYLPTEDDRMIFVIPWRDFSLVGTTDTDFDGDPDRLWATRDEVTYLLAAAAKVLPDRRVALENVAYTYAGVRPLSFEEGASESKVSRQHKVIAEGPDGRFLSVTGTKLTCFRSLAEEVGDRVMRALGRRAPSRTARRTLDGTDEEAGKVEARVWMDVSGEMAASGLGRETLATLIETYGR